MRVVFMGTPEFAVPSLEALHAITDVVGVYSRPDAVSGRGRQVRPSPVAQTAKGLDLDLRRPESLKTEQAVADLKTLAPDLIVVAAYGMILPPSVLGIAPLGAVNVHASLLPRWRGAAPIQRAILAGDEEVGVSIMRMEVGLDTGPYCLQRALAVGDADTVALTAALANLGAATLTEALPSILDATAEWTVQDESLVTYADKISKDDVAIAPHTPADVALRHIRASSPAAPCRVTIAGRGVTLLVAKPPNDAVVASAPGHVARTKAGVLLGVEGGAILVTSLKPDGKGAMVAADWARGVQDLDASGWDSPR